MAQCPVCQSELEITPQHHGTLYTCPKCSAVFFVDWDGHPEVSSDESSHEEVFSAPQEPPAELLENFPVIEEPPAPLETPPLSSETFLAPEELDYDFAKPLGEIAPPPALESDNSDNSDLSDIADFGNADLEQAAFNYTVIIAGIDSGKVRDLVREALEDSKFGWNTIQLISQIKDGVLTIRSVNAVKASILVQRVKYLPVTVSWRQDVLSSSI